MIEVERLTKDYGTLRALSEVSFSIGRGDVVGFVGPNGAGKSTTLRIITGFIGATSGRVVIDGHDIKESPNAARACIGYMPETAPMYPELRVREYLMFRAALKRVPRAKRKGFVGDAMERTHVTDVVETPIVHLSRGYRQRVALADALVAKPPLLILDEPTAGLDPNQIREVRALLEGLGESHTVLLSTHILSEVESTCHRALVIHRGKLVAEGPLSELRKPSNVAVLTLRGDADRVRHLLEARQVVMSFELTETRDEGLELEVMLSDEAGDDVLEGLIGSLVEAGVGVREAVRKKAQLEDVFSDLTEASR